MIPPLPLPTPTPTLLLWTLLAGGAGGLLRAGVTWAVMRWGGRSPVLGTLAVNLAGAALAGLALFALHRGFVGLEAWFLLHAGLLGALTTYSTWMLEVARMLREDDGRRATGYLVGTMAVGLLLAAAGAALSLR